MTLSADDTPIQEKSDDQSQRDVSLQPQGAVRPRLLPRQAHAPNKSRIDAALKYHTVDKRLAGGASGPAYVGMYHPLCDSVAA